MKRYLVIPFAAVMLFSATVYSQNDTVTVKVSKEKVKISGKFYYIHTVKPGETLYSIARAYQIAQAAIIESNPELYKGVKAGNSLKVPVVQDLKNPNANKDTYHIVKKGETLYAISRMYSVPVDMLSKLNMLENNTVKENQSLYIPASKNAKIGDKVSAQPQESAKSEIREVKAKEGTYEVQPKETIYSISKKFNLSVKELISANPGLEENGVKVGQLLVIPVSAKRTDKQEEKMDKPQVASSKECTPYHYSATKPFNVVLMLPLTITGSADTAAHGASRRQEDIFQYYQGTLLAVDSLKNSGVSVELTVLDTKNDQDKEALAKALRSPALKSANLIIGPVYPQAIHTIAPFAEKHGIPMVSPLSMVGSEVEGNPYLIQVATDNEVIEKKAVEFAKRNVDGRTVLVVPADGSDAKLVKEFKGQLKEKYPELSYRQGGYALNQREALKSKLVSGKKNRFIVLSNSEVFVLDFLQNLSIAAKGYDVEVLGTHKWQKFTSIDMEYMHNSNVEIFLSNYVDYSEQGAKSFVRNFRNYYKTEPNNYAFRGFDVAYYFIDALKSYGPSFLGCLTNIKRPNIHTPFRFVKASENGGYVNVDAVLIKHIEGFKIVKVK